MKNIFQFRKKFAFYFLSLFLVTSFFYACSDNDNFSTNSSLRLEFSADTVRFDTVFTTIGSATKRFKVYNRNKEAITINNVSLVSGGNKGFRINVDGEKGNSVSNTDILGNDSLFVFVEVTIDPLNMNNPLLITDSIRFQFNGVNQFVSLEATGQDAIIWRNKSITKDTTLTATKPYLIYGDLTIAGNSTLSIKEGVSMYFHKDAKLKVNGTLNALGTIDLPIVMRGDRLDNLFESPKVPYDRVHGQWGGVVVASNSYNNKLENVRIKNGVYGIVFEAGNDVSQQKATITNTMIQNTTKETLLAINSNITVANSLFANSGSSVVRLLGGSYIFTQTTIANYMSSYWGFSRGPALIVSNTGIDNNATVVNFDLSKAAFGNTIVAGSSSTELKLDQSNSKTFIYQFINCLIKNKGTDDNYFMNTIWGVDPAFQYIYSSETAALNPNNYYYYDFRLTESSPAREKGALIYATQYPLDIVGTPRVLTNAPDIGCYQWVSTSN